MDETNVTTTEPTVTEPAQPSASDSGTTTQATPSFDELLNSNKEYQSEFDRRVSQAIGTAQQKWEQSRLDELDESKKLEKMTQAQRDSYLLQKDREKLEKDKAAFAAEQMKTACGKELLKRGLDPSFAEYLTAGTAEQTNERLNRFEEAFRAAVDSTTNDKMRGGKPPKEPETEKADPFMQGFKG